MTEIEEVILFACPECGKVGSEHERCAHYVGGSRGHDHYKRVPVRLALNRIRIAPGLSETEEKRALSPQGEDCPFGIPYDTPGA